MDTRDRIRADALALCRAEETGVSIRSYGGLEIPDLLMNGGYADQMWTMRRAMAPLPAIAGARLQSRRTAVLHRDPAAEMFFVVNEHALVALEYGRGDPRAAVTQLRSLHAFAAKRVGTVRVLHFGARLLLSPAPALTPGPGAVPVPEFVPGPAFTITTDADGRVTAFADAPTPSRMRIVSDHARHHRRVAYYTRRFTELRDASLNHSRSLDRIYDALRRCQELAAAVDGRPAP
ncbi:MAG TPA: Scr1 family TA system antitoxin-like transcriptional regulator [Amycolatopsis sp.]|nr:Scr1 family TA system antitoxin-like transcriptional regulator [Amycolatopsis sp.]